MAVVGEAIIEVKPDSKGFGPDVEKNVLNQVSGIAKKAAGVLAGAFVVRTGTQFFTGALEEAEDARKIGALTEAVVKSTGAAANVSSEQLGALAERLSNLSGIDDEVIQGAGNVLLTFTKVRNELGAGNDVFDQAALGATNMAAALGIDLQGATLQVGKALNDPIKGISALTRAGVSFTAEQKEQVKTLVETGDVLGAQKIILSELETQFGGAAEAAASPIDRLKVAYGNLKETLGSAILPNLTPLIDVVSETVTDLQPVFEQLGGVVSSALTTILPVLVEAIGPIATTLADTFGGVITALGPVLEQLGGAFGETFSTLGPVIASTVGEVAGAFGTIAANLSPVIGIIGNALEAVLPIIGQVVGDIAFLFGEFVGPLLTELGPVFSELAEVAGTAFGAIGTALGSVVETLGPVLGELAGTVGQTIGSLAAALAPVIVTIAETVGSLVTTLGPVIGTLAGALGEVFGALGPAIDQVLAAFAPLIPVIGQVVADLVTGLVPIIPILVDAFVPLIPLVAELISSLVAGLAPILPVIGEAITTVAGLLTGALGTALETLAPIAVTLVQSLAPVVDALTGALAPVLPVIAELLGTVAETLGGALGTALTAVAPIFEVLAGVIAELAPVLGTVAGVLSDVLLSALQALEPVISAVGGVLGGVLSTALSALAPVVSAVAEALVPLVSALVDALAPVLPLIGNLLGTVADALGPLLEALSPIVELLGGVLGTVLEALAPLLETVASVIADVLTVAIEAIVPIIEGLTEALGGVIDFLTGVFTGDWSLAWDGIKAVFSGIWDALVGIVTGVWDVIVGIIEGAWDIVSGVFSAAWDLIQGIWDAGWNALTDVVSAVWDAITGVVSGAISTVSGFIGDIISTVTSLWSEGWNGLTGIVSGVIDTVVGFVSGLPERIGGFISDVFTSIADIGSTIFDGIADAFGAAGDFAKDIVNAVIDFINTQAIQRLNDLLEFDVGPVTINPPDIPKIPKLAYGDIINTPTLGIFGEAGPEVVLPLSNRKRLLELLMEALGIGGLGALGRIPQFAAGAIIGARTPSPSSGALDDLVKLVTTLLDVGGTSFANVPLTERGLTPGSDTERARLLATLAAIGAQTTTAADGTVSVNLASLATEAARRGRPITTSDLGQFSIDIAPAGSTSPVLARNVDQARAAAGATGPVDDGRGAFIFDKFTGFPQEFRSALVAQRAPGAEQAALESLLSGLEFRIGEEFARGVWFDRASGRVTGFGRTDEDQNRKATPAAAGISLSEDVIAAGIAKVGDFVPRDVAERWRAETDARAGVRRATLADITQTDRGWSLPDAWLQNDVQAAMIRAGWTTRFFEDGSGTAISPQNVIVEFAEIAAPAGGVPIERAADPLGEQLLELRRAWRAMSFIDSAYRQVDVAAITRENTEQLTRLLPFMVRLSVQAAGLLPGGWTNARKAGVDLPAYLARAGVPQLADGGIISPRSGGTLVNVGEAGRSEAVVPLPDGFLEQLRRPGAEPAAAREPIVIERVDLSGVRDAEKVPSALIAGIDDAIWQAS